MSMEGGGSPCQVGSSGAWGRAVPDHPQHGQAGQPHGRQPLQQGSAVLGDDHLGQVVGDE